MGPPAASYVPAVSSRMGSTPAVPIDPEILEPIWRQLGVADRVLIDAEANPGGVSYCPSGSRSASKIPLARAGRGEANFVVTGTGGGKSAGCLGVLVGGFLATTGVVGGLIYLFS